MITLNDNQLKNLLIGKITQNGTGSHYISTCPFCEKKDHFYIQRKTSKTNMRGENVSFYWHCKKCNENGSLFKLLKQIGRLDLIEFGFSINQNKLEKKINITESILEFKTEDEYLPIGFKRIFKNDYLDKRGFTFYDKYQVGKSSMYKDYLFFIINEGSKCKGYVGRLENNNKNLSRYHNSNNDFAKLLFGIDEISEETHTAILVEGIFKKFNVDKLLDLHNNQFIKCLVTFGKKISEYQMFKLQKNNIKNVVVLYDPDAIKEAKSYGSQLNKYFNTLIGFCQVAPDEMNDEQLYYTLNNLQKPEEFFLNIVNKKKLI